MPTAAPSYIRLDRNSPVPLYFQVAEQFEQAIVSGTVQPGERIETEVALAAALGLSRPTMRQAIQLLVDRGLVVRKRGVGTQVVHGKVRRPLELTSLHDDLTNAGHAPRTDVLSLSRAEASAEVAASLQVAAGDPVWTLERLRWMDDEPLALMTNQLPCALVDLSSVDLTQEGLYAALRARGVTIRVADQRIGARRATASEARLLGEQKGAPLLSMQRTAYDSEGRVVELGRHLYRPDLYAFELTLVDR
jgi:DNA-binding GntR family transcriptional regulator